MSTSLRCRIDPPPIWELEWRVVEITADSLGFDRDELSPQSRLFQDINFDSLDAMEFIMALEEAFDVTLSQEDSHAWFVDQRSTLRTVAQTVLRRWGTGRAVRTRWPARKRASATPAEVPSTQLGGHCTPQQWLDGQLYAALGENREGYRQFRRRTDGMRCVLMPGADVTIGNPDQSAPPDQRPAHRVELSAFLIDAEPVSNAAFCRFLNSVEAPPLVVAEWCGVSENDQRASHFQIRLSRLTRRWSAVRGADQAPMMLVSWHGANAYSLWANRQDWRCYAGAPLPSLEQSHARWRAVPPRPKALMTCLPSEAQWEYAAKDAAKTAVRCGEHRPGASYTAESIPAANVSAQLGMSAFGVHHMAGNVWQWCRDWYSPQFYTSPLASAPDAQNSEATSVRSERGGSWVGPAPLTMPYYRRGRTPDARGRCLGFRCIGFVEDLP
jgi:sulfatase modifying factor 1